MAELELITGHTGEQHVLAIDDAEIYRTLLGNGDFILSTGHKFDARMNGANKINIYDGTAIIQGRQMKIRSGYQELETDGGVSGYRREDAIVLEYSKSGDIEAAELKVIKGANNASAYKPPALIQGNIDEGQTRQVRLWGVRYNGINFESLIDYRTILDTTPIQTALDMATSGLRNIQALITSYQSQIDGDMSSYQSQVEQELEAVRNVARIAPLTTITGRNIVGVAGTHTKGGVTIDTFMIRVPAPTYTKNPIDRFKIYLNGLKVAEDCVCSAETTTVPSGDKLLVVEFYKDKGFTADTAIYDTVEVDVWRPEEA